MKTEKFLFDCALCRNQFQHGPHRYEGHKLQLYGGAFACDSCWTANHDGWAPHIEPKLLDLLKSAGLRAPPRNSRGWLPRD
jgi:hypothetical protein